jgi:hypothetical protein
MRMFQKLEKMLPRDGNDSFCLYSIDFYDIMKGTDKENQNHFNHWPLTSVITPFYPNIAEYKY